MTTLPTHPGVRPTTEKPSARAWVITGLLVVFMLINFGDKAVLGLAADPMMADLGMSASEYGLVSSSFYALFSISAIVVGFIANKRSNKRILLIMGIVWALTQLPVVFFASVATLLVSRTVLGAAEGPANPLSVNAAQKWFPDTRRNLPTSLVNLGAALGVVVMAPLLSYFIDNHGWRSAFFVMMVLGIIWSVVWAVVGRDGRTASATVEASEVSDVTEAGAAPEPVAPATAPRTGDALVARAGRAPYRAIFLSGTGLSVFAAGFVVYWALALLVAWVPLYLSKPLELGTAKGGTLVVLPWLVGAIVIPLQGFISDRMMQRGGSSLVARVGVSAVCILASGICMLMLTVVPGTAPQLAVLTFAFSLGCVQLGIGMTLMAEITPPMQRAAVLATLTAVTGLAGVIAPALAGRLIDAHGTASATGYHQVFLITGVLFLIGCACLTLFARPVRDAARVARLAGAAR
ncbi:MFS transporter [Nocardioides insulae]|uniref:MFS transporter n=1 Tax=Nocardioides insulae TaxID=394734 RepID=UPI0003F687B3|nr:MFS transporter [Nocardioides insulae]